MPTYKDCQKKIPGIVSLKIYFKFRLHCKSFFPFISNPTYILGIFPIKSQLNLAHYSVQCYAVTHACTPSGSSSGILLGSFYCCLKLKSP